MVAVIHVALSASLVQPEYFRGARSHRGANPMSDIPPIPNGRTAVDIALIKNDITDLKQKVDNMSGRLGVLYDEGILRRLRALEDGAAISGRDRRSSWQQAILLLVGVIAGGGLNYILRAK